MQNAKCKVKSARGKSEKTRSNKTARPHDRQPSPRLWLAKQDCTTV